MKKYYKGDLVDHVPPNHTPQLILIIVVLLFLCGMLMYTHNDRYNQMINLRLEIAAQKSMNVLLLDDLEKSLADAKSCSIVVNERSYLDLPEIKTIGKKLFIAEQHIAAQIK